jgi:hypothetical protein
MIPFRSRPASKSHTSVDSTGSLGPPRHPPPRRSRLDSVDFRRHAESQLTYKADQLSDAETALDSPRDAAGLAAHACRGLVRVGGEEFTPQVSTGTVREFIECPCDPLVSARGQFLVLTLALTANHCQH